MDSASTSDKPDASAPTDATIQTEDLLQYYSPLTQPEELPSKLRRGR